MTLRLTRVRGVPLASDALGFAEIFGCLRNVGTSPQARIGCRLITGLEVLHDIARLQAGCVIGVNIRQSDLAIRVDHIRPRNG